jgi:exonuclease VII small subunit
MKYLAAFLASVMLSGCAGLLASGGGTTAATASNAATTISAMPSPSEFDFVGKSKTEIEFMNPAALLESSRVEAKVIQEQCAMHTPDPVFFVFDDKLPGWTFAGRLNPDGTFQVLDYKNALTFGLSGSEQVGTWPVMLVALSDFPKEYLEDRLGFVGTDKIDAAQQKQLTAAYIANSQKLETIVAQLERSYDPVEECVQALKPGFSQLDQRETLEANPPRMISLRRGEASVRVST